MSPKTSRFTDSIRILYVLQLSLKCCKFTHIFQIPVIPNNSDFQALIVLKSTIC